MRDVDLGQQLVGLERRRERVDEELADRDNALAARARRTTDAPIASITEPRSPAGSAWRASRRWSRGCARSGRRSAARRRRSWGSARMTSERPRPCDGPARRWRSAPSRSSIPSRPGIRLMSTRWPGVANRSFMIGIRLCPPARTLASSPCCVSNGAPRRACPPGDTRRTTAACSSPFWGVAASGAADRSISTPLPTSGKPVWHNGVRTSG